MTKKIDLLNTPAQKDYAGAGWSVLIIRDETPAMLIYLPRDLTGARWEEVAAKVDCKNIVWRDGAEKNTRAYIGECDGRINFLPRAELGREDYKKTVYDDGEICIKKISGDMHIVGYKDAREQYGVILTPADLEGVARWTLTFRRGAHIWTRYEEHEPFGEFVRLLGDAGEAVHTLDNCGDGRFTDDKTEEAYRQAELFALDKDGEYIQGYMLGYVLLDETKQAW